jgi:hypothetical protein
MFLLIVLLALYGVFIKGAVLVRIERVAKQHGFLSFVIRSLLCRPVCRLDARSFTALLNLARRIDSPRAPNRLFL